MRAEGVVDFCFFLCLLVVFVAACHCCVLFVFWPSGVLMIGVTRNGHINCAFPLAIQSYLFRVELSFFVWLPNVTSASDLLKCPPPPPKGVCCGRASPHPLFLRCACLSSFEAERHRANRQPGLDEEDHHRGQEAHQGGRGGANEVSDQLSQGLEWMHHVRSSVSVLGPLLFPRSRFSLLGGGTHPFRFGSRLKPAMARVPTAASSHDGSQMVHLVLGVDFV